MSTKRNHKEKTVRRHYKEEKPEEPELPKYRDRAKERREDQNPDYEINELTSFHAVAPPGNVDLLSADAHKLSIEKSKYLGGDVEHTHLVKGLDYALLHKVRSEIDKKPDHGEENDGKSKGPKDDQPVVFRTASAKSVYQWIVKPQTVIKTNEMFLPGRMAFIYNMENGFSHDIPTTVHRSKADCPVPEEMVTVSVDGSVLDRIAKIMSYLRLGSSGKVLKKKKKDKDAKGKTLSVSNGYEEDERILKSDSLKNQNVGEILPPPPPLPKRNHPDPKEKQETTAVRKEEDDIFLGEGEWQNYQYAEQLAYPEQYIQQDLQTYDLQAGSEVLQDPHFMTQEEKDRGLGSVFKRDDQRLQQLREKDAREKDLILYLRVTLNAILVTKNITVRLSIVMMKMTCPKWIWVDGVKVFCVVVWYNKGDFSFFEQAKGRLHRWDFETEEEWATYNEQKEAMPKAAFQFGVKMQDGRKTRKQNREQKLTNDLHKINKILARKKAENGEKNDDSRMYDDESHPGKKIRI
ncbi:hypothetical protein DH2020_018467 [Rehmannia glutinosa]|uniref:RED-like N-terminal domain-containing protein n=1 Tax=Rehmannia glutinosa TaxID=99300 RepID=A0ABR0WNI8_REHGL